MRKVLLLGLLLVSGSWTMSAAVQPVAVAGTGDAKLDVAAVQAAVDHGGQVILVGHFSFDMPATKPARAAYSRMVTVSKQVVISGNPDEHGEMPVIVGGFFPFFIDVPNSRVSIRGLRFVRPKGGAIWSYSVRGLMIADCWIEGVEPSAEFGRYAGIPRPLAGAIFVGSNPTPPRAGLVEQSQNNSGGLSILNNDIDVGGTDGDQTLAICVFSVGKPPDKKATLNVLGNKIRNITERAIAVNEVGGQARIDRNVITTGFIAGPSNGIQPDVIHAVGSGRYFIAHNSIVSEWATGAGIRVQGSVWSPESNAIVVDNEIAMSAPEDTIFGANSAAIEIRGLAQGNAVRKNRIRGRARAALAVVGRNGVIPRKNTFLSNDLNGFHASLTSVFVDAGVTKTVIDGHEIRGDDHRPGNEINNRKR
jgi:hypothetical protein